MSWWGCLNHFSYISSLFQDDDAKVKKAFQTLLTYIGNIVKNPNEEKFRKIRLTNPSFQVTLTPYLFSKHLYCRQHLWQRFLDWFWQDRVGSLKGGVEFLQICGFEKLDGDESIFLARDKVDMSVLNMAGSEINSAISNPFFGIL